MSDQPLFKQTDEQEQVYAPQELPNDRRVAADEPPSTAQADRTAQPIVAGTVNAVPVPDDLDPGVGRDAADGEPDQFGRDPRDKRSR